jgi:uncharacterized protein YqeY
MTLKETILQEIKVAMKAGEKERTLILRTLNAAIKQVEIDTQKELTDEEVEQVVQRQVKQLQDALKEFEAAGREDLASQNRAEITLLSEFLPEQMSDEDLNDVIDTVLASVEADVPFGQLMGRVMKEVQGKADGNRVRAALTTKQS